MNIEHLQLLLDVLQDRVDELEVWSVYHKDVFSDEIAIINQQINSIKGVMRKVETH